MKHLKNIIQDLHRYLDAIFGFMFKFHYMFYKCISRQITRYIIILWIVHVFINEINFEMQTCTLTNPQKLFWLMGGKKSQADLDQNCD